jgi:hypothetical protein
MLVSYILQLETKPKFEPKEPMATGQLHATSLRNTCEFTSCFERKYMATRTTTSAKKRRDAHIVLGDTSRSTHCLCNHEVSQHEASNPLRSSSSHFADSR